MRKKARRARRVHFKTCMGMTGMPSFVDQRPQCRHFSTMCNFFPTRSTSYECALAYIHSDFLYGAGSPQNGGWSILNSPFPTKGKYDVSIYVREAKGVPYSYMYPSISAVTAVKSPQGHLPQFPAGQSALVGQTAPVGVSSQRLGSVLLW